jgi:hypothetical protein
MRRTCGRTGSLRCTTRMTGRTSRRHEDKHKHKHTQGQQPVVVIERGTSAALYDLQVMLSLDREGGKSCRAGDDGSHSPPPPPSRDHQASQQREAVYIS